MKQFFLARQYPRDQPRVICLPRWHNKLSPPSSEGGVLASFPLKLFELRNSKDRVESFAINRHRLILVQIHARWQIIILIALISLQSSKF